MITDSSIREQGYIYFLTEAPELLQTVEEELFSLADDYSIAKVHNLMRATHTLKGGAANVGLDVINKVAHSLEDIFKALYNPDVIIDSQLQTLLFQAYECLQLPVTAEITKTVVDNDDILQRAATVFAQLQEKLGDAFGAEVSIPTSEELGFDIVLSIFETGVSQRIDSITEILQAPPDDEKLAEFLRSQAEVFLGLAESLNLPGFGAIAQTILTALDVNPGNALAIAIAGSENLQSARAAVLAGDRVRGGEPSSALQQLSGVASNIDVEDDILSMDLSDISDQCILDIENQEIAESVQIKEKIEEVSRITSSSSKESYSLRSEVEKLYIFITESNSTQYESLKPATAKLYLKIIRYILGWFNHELDISEKELSLSLLIPKKGVDNVVDYVENWLSEFWLFLSDHADTPSLSIYRQGLVLNVLLSVAKFRYTRVNIDSPIIECLQNRINQLAQDYKKYPPITSTEKNWTDSPKLQKLLEIKEVSKTPSEPISSGIEAIWGEEITPTFGTNVAETAVQNPNFYQETHHNSSVETNTKLQIDQSTNVLDVASYESELGDTVVGNTVVNAVNTSRQDQDKQTKLQSTANNNKHLRQRSFVRVDVDGLQRLNYLAGELLIYQKRRTLQDEQLQDIIEQLSQHIHRHQATINELRDLPLQMQSVKQATQKVASIDFDSLEMDDYSEFYMALHSAQEETLQLQEIAESIDLILRQSTQVHEKNQNLTLNIIENIVEARMAPLANILNRFPQLVENLANVYGKKAEVKLLGTQVLVDKAISEKLYDPLLHLVRNAFDHGIEASDVRQRQGKSEIGVISIRAYHQGSQTIIEVRDDGQGLNFDKIRSKGIDLGLISDYHSTEEELLELLFSPGFSTAGQVSEISGRGIGLDIVKTQLHALNGSISVYSLPNQGTTFVLKIPFSMTTDQLMIVQAGGAVYALLLDSIDKILLPTSEQIKEFEGRKVLHWNTGKDERMVGLRNLSDFLYYNGSFRSGANSTPSTIVTSREVVNPVLVLRRNQDILALEVDQILGEQELVIRPLNPTIAPPKFIYGCSSLANGNLVLVIDGSLLLETSEMQATLDVMALPASYQAKKKVLSMSGTSSAPMLAAANDDTKSSWGAKMLPQAKPASNKNQKLILVVDDAISLRQTVSLTLQKAGYQVVQAQNGIEAVEQLQRHPEIELVVSDLEMPRMNGFELLSNVRQNTSLSEKPVIILTSRSAEKHRKLAEALGATAYMTKPYLEHEFIATVDGLMDNKVEGLTHVFLKV